MWTISLKILTSIPRRSFTRYMIAFRGINVDERRMAVHMDDEEEETTSTSEDDASEEELNGT